MDTSRTTAFRLMWELEHLQSLDVETDLEIKTKEWEYEMTVPIIPKLRNDLPKPVIFESKHTQIARIDFPISHSSWPIVSERMLDVLIGIGLNDYETIPMEVLGSSCKFYCIHLLNHLDIFDWSASEFLERSFLDENVAVGVSKYVIKTPKSGFPPIFRLKASPATLFVSHFARNELKKNGIFGPRYLQLDNFDSEVDVQIALIAPSQIN
jgi:hypothetical protein